jgi:hypothetical protein
MSETIIVRRTGRPPLRIRGAVIAHSESSADGAHTNYSGNTGRSMKVKVYGTVSGKHIAAIHHETWWQGEHDTDEVAVFPSARQCLDYLVQRIPEWMLHEIIQQMGEEAVAEETD